MRHILLMIAFFVAFLFNTADSNRVQAQSMARESYIPWQEADSTKYFNMTRCDICGEFVPCYNKEDLDDVMTAHYDAKHNGEDCGTLPYPVEDYPEQGLHDGNSHNGIDIYYYDNVVSIKSVASELNMIGVCRYQWFLDECRAYLDNNKYGYVFVGDMDRFLKLTFRDRLKKGVDLNTAKVLGYRFICFSNPSGFVRVGNIGLRICGVKSSLHSDSFKKNIYSYYVFN